MRPRISRNLNRINVRKEIHESTNTNTVSRRRLVGITWVCHPYDDLAAQGYRWVITNGPYACRSKDNLREIVKRHTDLTEVQMIQQPGATTL